MLWILWSLSVVALVALWWLGLTTSCSSLLKARQVAVLQNLPELRDSFESIQQLGGLMADTSAREFAKGPESTRLEELREQGKPFYHLYFVDSKGDPVVRGDQVAPGWLMPLVRQQARLGGGVLRPLPPGFLSEPGEVATPENYLVYFRSLEEGRTILWVLDWDYVFGPWLRRQLGRFGLGRSVSGRLVPLGEVPPLREPDDAPEPVTLASLAGSDFVWEFEVPTFLGERESLFDPLIVRVNNRPSLVSAVWSQLPYLAAGLILLLGLAVVLHLARRALRREAEYTRAKARFVSMVSHELRTPVTALEMYLQILREQVVDDPAKIAEYHRILASESRRLKDLVENLLAMGLAEEGCLQLHREPLDLAGLLREVAGDLNLIGTEEEFMVEGDREALHRVFHNLVDNARKFSEGAPVELRLEREEEYWVVSVLDRGGGLPEDFYEKVFEPYVRVPGGSAPVRGVGLGLALVKQLVEAHGGEVRGASRQGGGSIFSVRLPIGRGEKAVFP